uniref:Ecdysoneless homolog (Drosophila) n=1 Tax=Anabas testudineus TaxID=64144 RepID=A0A7N6ASA3_ANATE
MDSLQRKVVMEDMVQYKLFLVQPDDSTSHQIEEHFSRLVEEIMAKVAPLLIQYIWQHQSFNLKYHPEKGMGVPAHIGGSTQFGDNVDDEWFIVYLLRQITQAFPKLAARVEDNDGEFLLIEAADYLPKWLNPDTSENRVFLYKGELHILPCPSASSPVGVSKDAIPSVSEALTLLSNHSEACRASPRISSALRKRLEGYPEKIKMGLHRAHCFIPAGIAKVLAQRPDLVAPAVSAFYLRDPVDLHACRTFKIFPPDTRVLTLVTFTRCLYAQLLQQQFTSDRRSNFTLPPRSHPQYKAHELGMKLAHGFEILCSKCKLPSSEPEASISCNPLWKGFMDSLKRNDYFRGEIEGSARYRELTKSAENFFKQSVASKSSALSPGEEVLQLLHSCSSPSLEELKRRESQLPPEDSDSWLDITAQDLERMLQERSQSKEGEEEADYSLVAVSQGMKNFLNAMSSHEGAELPCKDDELDSDDLDDEEDEDEEDENDEEPSGHTETNETETLDSLKRYMDQMDQELMSTNIGQSFNQINYNNTDLGSGSPHPSATGSSAGEVGMEEAEEEIQPLDVDLNLVTNLLESLSCQAGLAGPASNLLQSLGLHLPPNSDSS